jgi:hypothetical protein
MTNKIASRARSACLQPVGCNRCEHRFAYARVARGLAQGQLSRSRRGLGSYAPRAGLAGVSASLLMPSWD